MGILTSYLLRTQDARVLTHSHRSWNLVASSKGFSAQIEARPRPRGVRGFSWVCWFWLDDVENASSANFPNHEWFYWYWFDFLVDLLFENGTSESFPPWARLHDDLLGIRIARAPEPFAFANSLRDVCNLQKICWCLCQKPTYMQQIDSHVLNLCFENVWNMKREASPAHCLALGCWLLFAKGFHHAYHLGWSIEATDIWQVSRKFKPPANRQPTWFFKCVFW